MKTSLGYRMGWSYLQQLTLNEEATVVVMDVKTVPTITKMCRNPVEVFF